MGTADCALTRAADHRGRAGPALSFLREAMGSSEHICRVFDQISLVAPTGLTVLITGETGSGKELVARAIHYVHHHKGRPFVPVDCGSIPPSLIESELFGHEKGSFTGADRTRPGKFEVAAGGTLFLDEISNLPVDVQPKLLRALQEKHVWRVGGTAPVAVNTRVVAAANQNLDALVKTKTFRRDLYHRLYEFSITVPPLRHRAEDIVHLAKRFIGLANTELNKNVQDISAAALERLMAYPWPGNVRELRNVIRRAVLMADTTIAAEHIIMPDATPGAETGLSDVLKEPGGSVPLKEIARRAVVQVERKAILQILRQTQGNKAKAARLLQIDYKTMYSKVKQYGISLWEESDRETQ